MRLIENREIEPSFLKLLQSLTDRLSRRRIDADDEQSTFVGKRIASLEVLTAKNTKVQVEKIPQFTLPVPGQSGRTTNDDTSKSAPVDHFADVKPSHHRLAGSRIVRQQEPKGILWEHVLINRDALMGQRNNPR